MEVWFTQMRRTYSIRCIWHLLTNQLILLWPNQVTLSMSPKGMSSRDRACPESIATDVSQLKTYSGNVRMKGRNGILRHF